MRQHLIVVAMLFLGAACNRSGTPKEPSSASAAAPITTVQVVKPSKGSVARSIEQPGALIADQEAPLFAKLAGFVSQYYFDIGKRVHGPKYEIQKSADGKILAVKEISPGDVLADISIPELQDESNQKLALKQQAATELDQSRQLFAIAKENVVAVTAAAGEARFAVKRAEANVKRWESEKIRIARLVNERTIDQQVGDETLNQYLAAEAAHNESKARVITAEALTRKSEVERDKAEADIKVAEAKLQVATAEAERLHNLLKYTKIRAPFDGIVTSRKIDAGHFQPAGNVKAVPLFTVAKIDTVRVVVEVPEADAALVQPGHEVHVIVAALKGKSITGKVSRTSGALDPASRTLRTEIDLPNPDGTLWPGMFANTRIVAKLPERWLLPTTAAIKVGDAMVCYIIEGGRLVRTPIQTGRSDGKFIEVLKKAKPGATDDWEDWTGNETVANSNVAYLSDGQAVSVSADGEPAKK